jgi:ABC-type multidrug transport system fused ATPase/permease subunit
VPQSPTIFSGTVADNVRLGLPDRSDESVRVALRAAGAESFVEALPEGLQTPLGEGGSDLSGGQRQRIAVARAWLRDAPLVVLDEFTAHLDTDTESEVLDAAADLLAGRTAIVVAHRLRTARLADRIVVLDAGRVVGSGSHEELLGTCSTYRTLVEEHRDGRLGALAARTPSHADGATAVEP